MNPIKLAFTLLSCFMVVSCQSSTKKEKSAKADIPVVEEQDLSKYETAYFASGCFWCVEAVFESVEGVKEAVSGYSGGTEKNPTYEQVGGGRTSHAESVKVYYDPEVVTFETLIIVFFGSHDPTTLNRQGPDKGAQYRSIAFYKNDQEKEIIENYISELEETKAFSKPIVTEVKKFKKFWKAEDYHQDYEKLHPDNPYVKNVSIPRLRKFQKKYPELLKEGIH
ncbi:peptide-methionine (S)-S-oxide reductase MsrA [Galbibacter sp. EGI 63066]|uniref:peptide-methionine (S)-S-oxide reductase MsrA n=1 Tax=Galbibacter sp. EGI 63066 TaxID=2993559 RepID=UPI0022489CA7|nr:peptide-methionine (S)-S-oxide reductase MsrA [Galbibacter sp. EGI 63066]MCX2680213.1 peptide-methionine (S)-S-oxide reductase MsrA [Galbibacter sp. EGI 63066]